MHPFTPSNNPKLFGHTKPKDIILDNYKQGHFHNSWLITGERGIGKASIAYQIARLLLSNNNSSAPMFSTMLDNIEGSMGDKTNDLYLDPNSPIFKKIAVGSHPDLLVLEKSRDTKTNKLQK